MATDTILDTDDKEQGSNSFLGFVLLEEAEWDKQAFLDRLQTEWGMTLQEVEDESDAEAQAEASDSEENDNLIFAEYDGVRVVVSLLDFPVPEGEAEHYASANYLWSEAVETVKRHKAQLLVMVSSDEADMRMKGILYSTVVANALAEEKALAVYTNGAVHAPDFYREVVQVACESQDFPLLVWVWFGYATNEAGQQGFYTYGLSAFGKEEMEIYSDQPLEVIRGMLYNIAYYVVSSDVVLNDGETIGLSEEQKLAITRSAGIALPGETLKIAF